MNKQEAWRYYKTWMREKTYCKALKSEVKVTLKGWDHLNKGGARKRTQKDKFNKFQLLQIAKNLIKNSKNISIEKRNNQDYYLIEGISNKYKIKVLLKKNNEGKYYFYSVMKH